MYPNYKILITGSAGFIGYHLSDFLCNENCYVTGIDNLNDYYDINLKSKRLQLLMRHTNFSFKKMDICDKEALDELFRQEQFDLIINLAAQAGVRYSIEKPYKYIDSNLIGFINVLEACRNNPVKHLFFASSSSVYGNNKKIPFSTDHETEKPASLYAATKKANELMAYSYAHLYNIHMTGLRFFTVYGPWGRPDMAYYDFTKNIINGNPIKLFNYGKMRRDFTYIDDVVNGIKGLIDHLTKMEFNWPGEDAPIRIFNIGNNKPVALFEFVQIIEKLTGKNANILFEPMADGDVVETFADIDPLKKLTGFLPVTKIDAGLSKFVDWFISYYKTPA